MHKHPYALLIGVAAAAIALTSCSGEAIVPSPLPADNNGIGNADSSGDIPTPDFSTPEPEPTPALPAPEDFTLEVIVLKEKCFGSVGCNVRFKIQPTYVGTSGVSERLQATVIYEVSGGETPLTNSFELLGGDQISIQAKESIQTPSASTELTATVTNIIRS